ncbi:hypothetical protein AB205_0146800 [Aquarana catesbeiana]|uniref:Uncharacterized protein n=1 Tax=Aquarana catesbeiana TaxID=8400 RepID=A0A2G9RRX7_AQUCT|nr:hypothetical protein AB205_0146800 [Aquarana catesbeiana]
MCTPPGDVLVVEGEAFSSDSAQRLIGQIMAWNGEIDEMRNCLDIMQQEMKNMIDVLGNLIPFSLKLNRSCSSFPF